MMDKREEGVAFPLKVNKKLKVNFWIVPQGHMRGDREVSKALYIELWEVKTVGGQYAIPAMSKQRKNRRKRAWPLASSPPHLLRRSKPSQTVSKLHICHGHNPFPLFWNKLREQSK